MAKAHQRAFALILAVLFFATSVGAGAMVIWQIQQDSETNEISTNEMNGAGEERMIENFEPVETVDELEINDLVEGDGETVKEGATVKAHYTGALAKDGKIFQSSRDLGDDPIEFSLDGVISGWTEGVPGMKVGGKRRLLIPYDKAYGEAGSPQGGIPAKADLVFDIEIVEVQNP